MLDLLSQLLKEKNTRFSSFEDVINKSDIRLKQLLKYVLTYSKFYKTYYAAQGITLKDIDNIKIEDLPFTSKEILMKNFDEVGSDPAINFCDVDEYSRNGNDHNRWYKNKYKIIKTSGSSGNYGFFIYDKQAWGILRAITINRASYVKVNPFRKNKLAIIVDTKGLHAGISLMGSIPKMFYDLLIMDVHEPQRTITQKLNSFQPDILSGYANSISMCAYEQSNLHLNIQPRQIACSGESLTTEAMKIIHRAFGISPINMYGSSESICIAHSTLKCKNLHVAYDWNLIEVVDEFGGKVREERTGNAVLTNLYNYSFPLIRYMTNDRISMGSGSCKDCRSIFPAITKIEGRAEDTLNFIRHDGSMENVYCSFIAFFNESNIKSFRVIQKERNYLEIQLVMADKRHVDATINKLDNNFKNLFSGKNLSNDIRYDFVIIDNISADEITGKIARIIPFEKYRKQLSKHSVRQEVCESVDL
jgi:phenylacetate-CoA ligase